MMPWNVRLIHVPCYMDIRADMASSPMGSLVYSKSRGMLSNHNACKSRGSVLLVPRFSSKAGMEQPFSTCAQTKAEEEQQSFWFPQVSSISY